MFVSSCHRFVWSALGLMVWLSAAAPANAQDDAPVKIGDRVEVKDFEGEWKPGEVTEIDLRHQRATVLLDEPDVPKEIANKLSREALDMHRRERADFDEIRLIRGSSTRSEKPRLWTDQSGKFRVRATFGGLEEGKVILKKTDGRTVKVPLSKLAPKDAEYVTKATAAADPFAGGTRDDDGRALEAEDSNGEWPVARANLRDVKTLRPNSFKEWSYQGKSASQAKAAQPSGPATLTPIEGSNQFFEDIDCLRVADDGNRAIVDRAQGKVGRDNMRYVELVDLTSARSAGLVPLPPKTVMLDASPGEGLIMFRPDIFGSGKNQTLYIGRIDGSELTPVTSWKPYENDDWGPRKDIKSAWFLDAGRVLTINEHGAALTVWETADARAVLNVPVANAHRITMALSPNRQLLAIAMSKGIALIDLVAGQHVATLQTREGESCFEVAIRADHQRLAATSDLGLTVWDLTTGSEIGRLAHPVITPRGSLRWAGQWPLVDECYLFDAGRRVILWEYSVARVEAAAHRGGRFWFVPRISKGGPILLGSAAMPHGEVEALAAALGTPEELLVVKPGDSVKIEVDVDSGIARPDEIRSAIEENATKAGLNIADEASLVISAICKRQERQTIRINTGQDRFHPDSNDIVTKTITPHASLLEMTLAGQTIYKRGYIAKPGMTIWLEEGESLDQALARITKPNVSLLKNTRIPGELGQPGDATSNGAYGASTITVDGIDNAGVGARFE